MAVSLISRLHDTKRDAHQIVYIVWFWPLDCDYPVSSRQFMFQEMTLAYERSWFIENINDRKMNIFQWNVSLIDSKANKVLLEQRE